MLRAIRTGSSVLGVSLAIVAGAAPAASASASPGVLDPAFNGTGVVSSSAQLLGVAVQPNGEVVAAGQSGGNVYVARFTAAGAPDGAYTGPAGAARAVAVQADGEIVIAGSAGSALLVERLTPALAPDPGFGAGGIATVLSGQSASANAVAIGPGGTIVAAGSFGAVDTGPAVAELTSAGAPVSSFGSGGVVTLDFGGYSSIAAIAVAPDGKVVLAGRQTPSQSTNGVLGRLTAGGGLDGTFAGGGGVLTYHYPGGGYTSFTGVALQNDGRIIVSGVDVGGPNALVLRYGSDGSLDPGFGSGGVTALSSGGNLPINPGGAIGAAGVVVAGGGRIIAGGSFERSGVEVDAAAYGVTADGAPESTFGTGHIAGGPAGDETCATAIAPDGSIVTAGDSVTSYPDRAPCTTGANTGGFVARYGGYGPPPVAPPVGTAPSASTGAATALTQTSATLTGSVNPGGLATSYHFDYGTTTSYGSSTAAAAAGSGTAAIDVSAALGGLLPSTTYHYRLVATNADGTGYGADASFTTASAGGGGGGGGGGPLAPTGSTGPARALGEVAATLTGILDPQGSTTTYAFEYGTSTAYGQRTAGQSAAAGAGAPVSVRIGGLKPGTRYHYRLLAANDGGTLTGLDATFQTLPRIRSSLRGVGGRYRLAGVLAHGIRVKLTCSQACTASGSLGISARTAKQLKLGRRGLSIASGRGRAGAGKLATLIVKLTRGYARRLARARRLTVTLRTVTAPAGGGPVLVNTKTITLHT